MVVGQRRRQPDDPDHLLRRFYEAEGSRDERLDHGTTLVVEQMYLRHIRAAGADGLHNIGMAVASLGKERAHLVDDEQADALYEAVRPLPSDHVPLLGRRDDEVRALHLCHMSTMVAS